MGAEGRVRAARRPDTLFWVDAARVASGSLTLDHDESHHLLRVHRAERGAPFEATDGAGALYRCVLAEASEAGARGEIVERLEEAGELPAAVHLVVGLPDARATESVVEHAVPLGAASIVFVSCERSARDLPGPERIERLRRIAVAGVKQSRRSRLPSIGTAGSLAEALRARCAGGARFVADPGGQGLRAGSALSPQAAVIVTVGPPGGFTDGEAGALRSEGFLPISLGPNRLSTDTAAVALLCEVRKNILDSKLGRI